MKTQCSAKETFTPAEALKDQRKTSWIIELMASHSLTLTCMCCVWDVLDLATFYHCGFPHMYIYCMSI